MNTELQKICTIRDMRPGDFNFVKATFLNGLYYGNEFYNLMPKEIFMNNYKLIADQLIIKSTVSVACVIEDPNVIIGFSILSKDLAAINWVHVKKRWRKAGVARSLVPPSLVSFSHFTSLGLSLRNKISETLYFDPFRL